MNDAVTKTLHAVALLMLAATVLLQAKQARLASTLANVKDRRSR